jgi:trimethyllysine dioxygenase
MSRKVLWGSKIANEPPSVPYDEITSNERGVYTWLSKIVS